MRFLIFFYDDDTVDYKRIPENNRKGPFPAGRKPRIKDCVRPFRDITLIRCMNTVIGLIFALARIEGDIPLDRIGTHPLENFFGLLRRILHDRNRFDELLHAAARTIVVDNMFQELEHPRDICGRKSVGGVVCKFNPEEHVEPPVDPEPIYNDIQTLVSILLVDSLANIDETPGMKWLCAFNNDSMTAEIMREGAALLRINSSSRILPDLIQGQGLYRYTKARQVNAFS
jgi:hypothetical protein